jgi:hypothetical protein
MGLMGWLVAARHLDYALDPAGADLGLPPSSGRIFLEPGQAKSQVGLAPAENCLGSHSMPWAMALSSPPKAARNTRRARSTTPAVVEWISTTVKPLAVPLEQSARNLRRVLLPFHY